MLLLNINIHLTPTPTPTSFRTLVTLLARHLQRLPRDLEPQTLDIETQISILGSLAGVVSDFGDVLAVREGVLDEIAHRSFVAIDLGLGGLGGLVMWAAVALRLALRLVLPLFLIVWAALYCFWAWTSG